MQKLNRRSLMYLSWFIQGEKKYSRSRSLTCAWALLFTEDIAIQRLIRKHSGSRSEKVPDPSTLTLFRA